MGTAFEAETVTVQADGEPQVTFWAPGPVDDHFLRFSRIPADEQGDDPVCCENTLFDEAPFISNVLLTPTRLVVNYYLEGTAGGPQELVVGHSTTGPELKALRRGMRRVFRGTGAFVDDAATGVELLDAILVGPPTPTSEMLVMPLYMTLVGVACGVSLAAVVNPWLIPLGVVGGGVFGCLWGYAKRGRFYFLHKYR